jgi:hypothetical protein
MRKINHLHHALPAAAKLLGFVVEHGFARALHFLELVHVAARLSDVFDELGHVDLGRAPATR